VSTTATESSSWDRLMRLLGGESGVSGCDIEGRDEDDVEDVEDRLFDFVDDNMEARAALLMGTWIPRLGSDNDLRRVLYGIVRTRRTKCLTERGTTGTMGVGDRVLCC